MALHVEGLGNRHEDTVGLGYGVELRHGIRLMHAGVMSGSYLLISWTGSDTVT